MGMPTVKEITDCHITPFCIEDKAMTEYFSYYLHQAPTIDSSSAGNVPSCGLDVAWEQFVTNIGIADTDYFIYAEDSKIDDRQLEKYKLTDIDTVKRNDKRFVCKFKREDGNSKMKCLLRHLRNSIAHSNVFLLEKGRKYIIFVDYNINRKITSKILLSQTDLNRLKRILEK